MALTQQTRLFRKHVLVHSFYLSLNSPRVCKWRGGGGGAVSGFMGTQEQGLSLSLSLSRTLERAHARGTQSTNELFFGQHSQKQKPNQNPKQKKNPAGGAKSRVNAKHRLEINVKHRKTYKPLSCDVRAGKVGLPPRLTSRTPTPAVHYLPSTVAAIHSLSSEIA